MTSRIPDHQQQTDGKVPRDGLTKEQVGMRMISNLIFILLECLSLNIRMYDSPDLSPAQSLSQSAPQLCKIQIGRESWKVNVDNPGVLSVQLRVQCICRSVTMYETM